MQLVLPDLLSLCADAESAADRYETEAREAVRKLIAPMGKVDAKLLEREQFAAHGFAWIATYVSAILNIFEGAAEIQAQVVCRGLLEGRN